MVIFLTSLLRTHHYDENGNRVAVALQDDNGILTNIRKRVKHTDRLVVVANDQHDSEDNDRKLAVVGKSFRLTGFDFKQTIALDARNKASARAIISGADIVILSGGKCVCQTEFFDEIQLKDILTQFDGIVIGVSAGAMSLCKTVANFPEETADIAEPRWLNGMGVVDEEIIIPHYDGETDSYQFPCEDFDIAKDYILPMSHGHKFTALPNDSYILIGSDGQKQYFGDAYRIKDGKTTKI